METRSAQRIVTIGAIFTAAVSIIVAVLWMLLAWTVARFYKVPLSDAAMTIFVPSAIYLAVGLVAAYLLLARKTRVVAVIFLTLSAIGVFLLGSRIPTTLSYIIDILIGVVLLAAASIVFAVKEPFIKAETILKPAKSVNKTPRKKGK